jgi:hypothetical protein
MQEFLEIAKTDFSDTFSGAWIFPIFLLCIFLILWKEKDWTKKILLGILPLVFLFFYWCPVTGILFMKILGENVYWRILWLLLLAVIIPYGFCLLIGKSRGLMRNVLFLGCMAVIVLGGKQVLSAEWFEPSLNAYKIPQNVIEVCELLPGNIHAMVSNRLMPYIRMYDPTITLEYGRNALGFNGQEEVEGSMANLYLEAQKSEIDLSILAPLAKSEGCTFLVFSNSRTFVGDWEEYGYEEYGSTDEFVIFVDKDYEEGQDTRKWEE